ncbi:MAG TPA: IPT/TIG domain-containing protein, partial [Bryobacteraceae bacterium]|nr:IPT/TIG domain-containing protein [Bryobacteraceae bacterium]
SVGLGPFVETQTTSGKVGAAIKILGTDLTGATSVSFNGTAAVFDVVASSLIAAKVPAGATSGKVEVVTPNGTLSSNLAFRVLP